MNEKFRNRYRIPSNRLRGWDYAGNGHYFITIVTHNRIPFFGNVVNGEIILNEMGKMVYNEFFKSFETRKELFLGEFILMPNHLHAIVILDKSNCTMCDGTPQTYYPCGCVNVGLAPQFRRKPKSISSFVAGFKSATINHIDDWIDVNNSAIRKFNRNNPLWQANYYDHIIRNETEYRKISTYITENPLNWDVDVLKR